MQQAAQGYPAPSQVKIPEKEAVVADAARLGAEITAEIANALTPLAQVCVSVVPYPSPIGVPSPGAAG